MEASFYRKLEDNSVQCFLCPHHCKISDGAHGICLTRQNNHGILEAANYCRPVLTAIDPIEKKPLYHFYPGSSIFSTGPNGCTLKCAFCQNYEISQQVLTPKELSSKEFFSMVKESKTRGIAYTYSEPFIWYETIMEIGPAIHDAGLVNVMVTNGYMESAPLKKLIPFIDAMNIDIKSMNPQFYKKLCKGQLEPVLKTCETVKKQCHLEITNLLITDENDSDKDIEYLVSFITQNLGKETPLHLSRYYPRYKLDKRKTDEKTLLRAWEIASESLDYVYLGNMYAKDKTSSFCPSCKALLVNRSGYYTVQTKHVSKNIEGRVFCKECKAALNFIF